ncbi:MAG: hypothetical protein IPN67_10380 [Bacteroidales bacterium]|nr:hypothetical protein [Bacteroidales bacterium]
MIILLNGCSSEEHIEFKDVPINGHSDMLAAELNKLGFTGTQLSGENQIKLHGVFLEKDCEIHVYGTRKSQTAYKVVVNLPGEVRDSLESSFGEIQKLYSSKYGRGTNRYLQYQNAERFLFNEPKLRRRLSTGDFSRYTTGSGSITVEVREGYISITYLDKRNNEIGKSEMEEETAPIRSTLLTQ